MPSPLPGMDPFLEDRGIFPDLHDSLITYLREALNAQLPEPYFATSASRVWIEPARRRIGSDVNVLRPDGAEGPAMGQTGGTATAEAAAPVIIPVPREEVRETFLEIRSRLGDRLVTAIEVLSPTNKTPAVPGRPSTFRSNRRFSKARPTSLRSTCSAAASTPRPSLPITPGPGPGRSTTTSASTPSIGPTTT